ncbi:MAG: D-glycero-alpha-D-manno-heptose-1,7-bisphosphate 7-phosphatase [Pyramidobacter sp.]|jgi:D-glycero-D-manno-heptose 1,7-bisphosphate phosphatase
MDKKNWIILDRDGTIIEERNYLHSPEQVVLLPWAAEGLKLLCRSGYRLTVVSNQSGVGRGYFSADDVERVHNRLAALLNEQGVELQGFYYCPHRPDEGCACRKPRTGLIRQAAEESGLSVDSLAAVIGDKECDMQLGRNLGCPAILLMTGYGQRERARGVVADFYAENLRDAALWIMESEKSGGNDGNARS